MLFLLENRLRSPSVQSEFYITVSLTLSKPPDKRPAGFPQALEIMENLENHEKKFHEWKNHGI